MIIPKYFIRSYTARVSAGVEAQGQSLRQIAANWVGYGTVHAQLMKARAKNLTRNMAANTSI
jgi:hypothetical protein